MTAFRWQGTDTLGLPQHGILEAQSLQDAELQLAGLGVSRVRIRQQSGLKNPENGDRTAARGGKKTASKLRVRNKQLATFCRQLANLLTAGIPIIDAIDILEDESKGENAQLLKSLRHSLLDGLKLGEAMALHPEVFDPYFVNLVRCEEVAGQLHRALSNLADHLKQTQLLHRKIRQSLMQPGLILITAVLVTWLLLTLVMPEFAKMYTQQDQQLPGITQWVIGLSTVLQNHQGTVLLLIAGGPVAALTLSKRVAAIVLISDRLLLGLPLLGSLIRQSNIVEFSRTLAGMLTAGIPLNEGLIHAGAYCRNAAFRHAISQTTASVENGSALHHAMTFSPCFPAPYRRMIRLGEETGKLSHMLEHASQLYRESIQRTVDNLLPLIEPILMLILGAVVGGLILAMYLPIFSMGTLLQS